MRTQPNRGLRRFISMMAAMSSAEGPLGPGLRRCDEEEKSRRYLRSTKALWNLNRVAGLTSAPSFGIRRGLMNSVVSPSTNRSIEVRFGARGRERLLMSNWCFRMRDSATTARATAWAEQLREGDKEVD